MSPIAKTSRRRDVSVRTTIVGRIASTATSIWLATLTIFPAAPLHAQETAVSDAPTTAIRIEESSFGSLPDGREVKRYVIRGPGDAEVELSNYGATLMQVRVPDRDGNIDNVNIAFDSLQPYLGGHPYFGSTVGRYANRIGGASFTIDGQSFALAKDHGDHILHGGPDNFAHQLWDAQTSTGDDNSGAYAEVTFTLRSPDGENGFPGNVHATCRYRWDAASRLTISFEATTDAATHLSLTNHSYFNLAGVGSGKVLDHVLTLQSDQTLAVDEDLIPHGEFDDVAGTAFDFRDGRPLGEFIDTLPQTKGYDHCFVVRGEPGTMRPVGEVIEPTSGRTLKVSTTLPGVQLYTANHLSGSDANAGQSQHEAFCLETQMYPNTPNVPNFPSTLVRPGQTLTASTIYQFGVQR